MNSQNEIVANQPISSQLLPSSNNAAPEKSKIRGYLLLFLLLSSATAAILAVFLPYEIGVIRTVHESGGGLGGFAILLFNFAFCVASFWGIIFLSLILYRKYKLNIFISVMSAVLFSGIACIGPGYFPLAYVARSIEQSSQKKEFNITLSKVNERLNEVNKKVHSGAMAGPAYFEYKYEYITDVMIANHTMKEFSVEIAYQFRVSETTSTDSARLFHSYDRPRTPYEPFKPLKTVIKPGDNRIQITLPIYFNDYLTFDFSNGVDMYLKITTDFDTLFPPREIQNKISREFTYKTDIENWEGIHAEQLEAQKCKETNPNIRECY